MRSAGKWEQQGSPTCSAIKRDRQKSHRFLIVRTPHTAALSHLFSEPKAKDNDYGAGYVGASPGELNFGYVGPSPIEWRAKEHANCMAIKDYAAADEWLDEIERELKIARHWLAVAKSPAAQGGAK